MPIRCVQCGANNHWGNSFCLNCGADLDLARETPKPEPVPPQPAAVVPPISPSPSAQTTPPSVETIRSFNYVFQEEPSDSRHALRNLLLVLFVLAAATAVWKWREVRTSAERFSLQIARPSQAATLPPSPSPPTSAQPAAAANAPPASTEAAGAQIQTQPEVISSAHSSNDDPNDPPKAAIHSASERTRVGDAGEIEGEKYLYGDGVPVNCDLAQKDLLAAAKHSSAKAESALGTMYATGHCAIRDLPLAYRWFARAQHQNQGHDAKIAAEMRNLWNQMSPEEKQLATR